MTYAYGSMVEQYWTGKKDPIELIREIGEEKAKPATPKIGKWYAGMHIYKYDGEEVAGELMRYVGEGVWEPG